MKVHWSALAARFAATAALCGAAAGCAALTARKATGEDDEGVQYFAPKPYFRIARAAGAGAKAGVDGPPRADVVYLPDRRARRTILAGTGLGAVDLNVDLADGWRLSALHGRADTKFDDTLRTVPDRSFPIFPFAARAPAGPAAPGAPDAADSDVLAILVGIDLARPDGAFFDEAIVVRSTGVDRFVAVTDGDGRATWRREPGFDLRAVAPWTGSAPAGGAGP